MQRGVEMHVQDGGETRLAYTFRTIGEAAEMMAYLKDFFPEGRFIIQPLRH